MADLAALVGRIMLAALFIPSGYMKLMQPGPTIHEIAGIGMPVPPAAYVVTVAVELVGGLLLLAGVKVRWVAAALAVFTLVAAYKVHLRPGDMGQMINFMKNVAIAGGLLQVVAFGSGRFALRQG